MDVVRFGKVPWSSIRRNEMYSWLYWSIFNARFPGIDKVPEHERKALQEVTHLLELRAGVQIPEGSNPAAAPLLLTLDPVNIAWRPLMWYTGITVSNAILRRRLLSKWHAKVTTYKDLE